jgi:hypothetical protein
MEITDNKDTRKREDVCRKDHDDKEVEKESDLINSFEEEY